MKLIYITEGVGAVFQSQIVQLLNYYSTTNQFKEIILLVGLRDPMDINSIVDLDSKIKIKVFKSMPQYPLFNRMTIHSLANQFSQIDITNKTILHCRGEYLGSLVSKVPIKSHPKLLIDIRGVTQEEIELYSESKVKKLKLWYLNQMISKTIQNADLYSTVTDDLKTHLINNFHLPSDKVEVNHCIAGLNFKYTKEKRTLLRDELGVSGNDTLFIFSSGSTQKWQNDEYIAMALAERGYKVLMLTKKHYEHDNIITKFVPQHEVSDYLNAADIGIILRSNDIVNQVASPIKFSEYLACGLPIVSNHSVKLIEKIIQKNNCGILLDSLKELDQSVIDSLLLLDREKISLLGSELFGIEKISNDYISLYSKLLGNK